MTISHFVDAPLFGFVKNSAAEYWLFRCADANCSEPCLILIATTSSYASNPAVRGFPARRGWGAWLEPPKGLGINRQLSINLKIHAEASIG